MNSAADPSPRFQPPETEATAPFWEATRRGEYLVQWCGPCDAPVVHPREICPYCLVADGLDWRPSSGRATVYAHSVQHRAPWPGLTERVPYVVALVDLDAGASDGRTVRIMTNVIDVDPTAVRNGDAVRLDWEPLEDGRNLAVFRPAG